MEFVTLSIILTVCFLTGSYIEKNHYKSIKERELRLYKSPVLTFGKAFSKSSKIKNSFLVSSSVVIGCDFFKVFVAAFRSMLGGNVATYESVLDRARREALLRIREQAIAQRANAVINVKLDTIILDAIEERRYIRVCVVAYGTAIEYVK